MTPEISIIIPFYNCEQTVKKCLDSVVGQTFGDFEVIMIDDGSEDESQNICQEYAKRDERIRIYQQKNKGPGQARNKGIELSLGNYLIFLDADDFWEPDLLEMLYRRSVITDADMVACRFWLFDDKTSLDQEVDWDVNLSVIHNKRLFNPEEYSDKIFQIFNTAPWFSLYKKSFIVENGIHFAPWIRSEDNLFTMSAVAMAKKVSIVNRRLIHYRVNTGQKLENKIIDLWENTFNVFVSVKEYLESKGVFEQFKKSFINCELSQIRSYLLELIGYPVKSFVENRIVQKVIPEFNLIGRDDKLFESYNDKTWLCRLERKKNYSDILEKLFYDKRDCIVPIVYTASEKTLLNLVVSIESIRQNQTKDHFYDIYVLHTDLTPEWQSKLEDFSQANVRVTCVDVQKYLPAHIKNIDPDKREKSYLCFLDKVIDGYDKIICLSPNTIVFDDIFDLFKVNIGDNILAACHQDLFKNRMESISVALNISPENCISEDVLVIDLLMWKKQEILKRLLNLFLASKGVNNGMITMVCLYRTLFLDEMWNQCISVSDEINPEKTICYNPSLLNQNQDLFHFWWKFARQSPCFEAILLTGVKKKMWHILPLEDDDEIKH